jgi:hypothetical protein
MQGLGAAGVKPRSTRAFSVRNRALVVLAPATLWWTLRMLARGDRSSSTRARLASGFAAVVLLAACAHDWAGLDPLSSSGTTGTSTSSGGTSTSSGASSSSSSSSSGGPTCGRTNLLSWSFAADDPWVFQQLGTGTSVSGNVGSIALPSGAAGAASGSFQTKRLYDLRDDHVNLQVISVPSASTAAATVSIAYDSGDAVSIGVNAGKIDCSFFHGGTGVSGGTATYDPTADALWQLRESSGTIFCEVSKDGNAWTTLGSFSEGAGGPAPPAGVHVAITAAVETSTPSPGTFSFTNLNGGGTPTGTWCKATTITDDFSGPTAPNDTWDRVRVGDAAHGDAWDQIGGKLNLHFGETASSYANYTASRAYDMTGERMAVEVTAADIYNDGAAELWVGDANMSVYWIVWSDGAQCISDTAAGSSAFLANLSTQSIPTWVSLRESGGIIYCEQLEPDGDGGMAWKVRGQTSAPWHPTAVDVSLSAAASTSNSSIRGNYLVSFDNMNLPPVP